jgi:hypothetical protein
LAGIAVRGRSVNALRTANWKTVLLPYASFAAGAATLHLFFPTVLIPNVPGAAMSNIPFRFKYYQDVVAEHIGLKDPGLPMQLLDSPRLAKQALAVLAILAVIGVIGRLLYRFEEDIALAAYLCCATFLMLVSPYQDSRYFFTITPLMAYFAYQALPTVVAIGSSGSRALFRIASVVPAVGLVGLVLLNAQDLAHSTNYHRHYHYTVNGPESPDAKEMFTAVKEQTRGDDVILFFRARAMTLYSDRRAVQGSNLDQMLKRSDWYVMAKDSTYSQTPLTDAEGAARGLTKAWENATWVIWRVPPRA